MAEQDAAEGNSGIFRAAALRHRFRPSTGDRPPLLRPLARRRTVPVIAQTSQTDCGAACLAMVMAALGKHVPVRQIRDAIVGARDGTSAAAIVQAAEHFGLRAEGLSVGLDDLEALDLPAILHWDFQHFVVLDRWSGRRGRIVDPAAGRLLVRQDSMDRHFTGVALVFEPGPNFQTAGRPRRNWKRYAALAQSAQSALAKILELSLLLQVLGLVLPAATAFVVDRILPRRGTSDLTALFWGAAVFACAYAIATTSRNGLLITLQARFSERLSLDFFKHLLDLPFPFFQSRTTGDLMLRLASNAVLRDLLSQQALSLLLDGGLLVTYTAILLWKAPHLAYGVLVLAGAESAATVLSVKAVGRLSVEEIQAQSASQGFLVESLRGIETIKTFSAERRVFDRGRSLIQQEIASGARRQRKASQTQAVLTALHFGSPLLLLAIGAAGILSGTLPTGAMLGSLALAGACLAPVGSLLASVQNLQRANVHFDRIEEVFQEPREHEGARQSAPVLEGAVEFDHVTHAYGPLATPALSNVSLRIDPGELVAIVGSSGSGKSTLARLLLGLYPPTRGRVLLDGHDLRSLDLRSVRRQIGTVLQGGYLFRDTIWRNLTFVHPDLPAESVREAARRASIDETIERLPLGYDTPLSEMGSNLSGGQRQRICIARALAAAPRIVLLDEATSELDAVSEAAVYRNLADLRVTRVVIAHRLSTVRQADRIFVLDGGRLIETGSHASLVRERGMYATLLRAQEAIGPAA